MLCKKKHEEIFGIQYLRAFAAILVVAHHVLEESNASSRSFSPDWLTTFGAAGVDIFFVISGFIIMYTSFPIHKSTLTAKSFLIRRITRIYPLYWACCAIIFAIFIAGFLKNNRPDALSMTASFFLLPSNDPIMGVSWTLVYELYFYLIFAATLKFRNKTFSAIATTIAIAIMIGIGNTLGNTIPGLFLSNPITLEFTMGIWLAMFFLHIDKGGKKWPLKPASSIIAFAIIILASALIYHPTTAGLPPWPRVLAWGIPATLITAAFLGYNRSNSKMSSFVILLGNSSYAIYLTHVFVMIAYGFLLRNETFNLYPQYLLAPLAITISVMIGVITHEFVETPLLNGIRSMLRHQADKKPSQAQASILS